MKTHVRGVKIPRRCEVLESRPWTCENACYKCEFPRKCEFPGKLNLTFDLQIWPWTWPLFHRRFGTQTIYYSFLNKWLLWFENEKWINNTNCNKKKKKYQIESAIWLSINGCWSQNESDNQLSVDITAVILNEYNHLLQFLSKWISDI